jgi:hypothetical protein
MVVPRPSCPLRISIRARLFMKRLAFKKLLDADVGIFGIRCTVFILTSYHHEGWAENSMMQLMVDDLDVWWDHITALDLPAKFGFAAQGTGTPSRRWSQKPS